MDLIRDNDNVVRSAHVRRADGLVEVHSLKHLYPLELSVAPNNIPEPEVTDSIEPTVNEPVVDGDGGPSCLSSVPEDPVWLCPICNAPRLDKDMIGCDSCGEWYHFQCVGIDEAPPRRRKWYCPECTPQKRRRGRPSLLPA